MNKKTYLGYDKKRKAEIYWLPDGKRIYKYFDGRCEIGVMESV